MIKSNNVEILCIGTEILLGDILNTNAQWISKELASLGLPHFRQTVIGDNSNRLVEEIKESAKRSRYLITTGGLGPTPDDLTTAAIARAFNTPMELNKEVFMDIKNKFNKVDIKAPNSNRKQALLPLGAKVIPNPSGTAPGMIWSPKDDFTIITFPGVPSELKKMWVQTVEPWIKEYINTKNIFVSKTLKFTDISESALVDKVGDLMEMNNPTIAPYASLGEVRLRITANAKNIDDSNRLIKPVEDYLMKEVGDNFYGFNDDSLASIVINLLRDKKETLVVAESCTGGGLGAAITEIPGSSDVFLGGVIAYSNLIKNKILEVPIETIEKYGAVSNEVVESMAKNIGKKFKADWSIAISGVAGPSGGTSKKPIGYVQFCISGPGILRSSTEKFNDYKGRIDIQKLSVVRALDKLRLILLAKS